jgi:hypothetical protein
MVKENRYAEWRFEKNSDRKWNLFEILEAEEGKRKKLTMSVWAFTSGYVKGLD